MNRAFVTAYMKNSKNIIFNLHDNVMSPTGMEVPMQDGNARQI